MDGGSPDGLLGEKETFQIRSAAFEVYRAMGAGFLEAVCQECLEVEFGKRGLPFEARSPMSLSYQGQLLRQTYVADFLCYGRIIVELKAARTIAPEHRAQTVNYLRVTNKKPGLLINFGATPKVEIERFIL